VTRSRLFPLAALYALLVAHLLFLPYAYQALPVDAALARFVATPWVDLGPDQNVALVARAMMFLPMGLLLAWAVAPHPRRSAELPAFVVATAGGTIWALGVNFLQEWFPARTVLLNLVAAELAGVTLGAAMWSFFGWQALQWSRRLARGGRLTLTAALTGYTIAYVLASLMPGDFVTNGRELAEKLASSLWGWWQAPVGCGPASCGVKLLVELATTVPCGWWFASIRRGRPHATLNAFLVGVVAGSAIEALHLLMVSGVSQGISVLVRAAGMAVGAATFGWRGGLAEIDLDRFGRPLAALLALPYLAAVGYVGGWLRTPIVDPGTAGEQARRIVWMPFYYLYYTPYTAGMQSLIVHFALYLPVGGAVWLWSRRRDRISPWYAAAAAAFLALAAETSKVFLLGRHPDYTDILLAAAAAPLALAILRWGASPVSRPSPSLPAPSPGKPAVDGLPRPVAARATEPAEDMTVRGRIERATPPVSWQIMGGLLVAVVIGSLADFPLGVWALGALLLAYAAALWRRPLAYLLVMPIALPLLDLSQLSGRFFWDAFDLLLCTTLGVRLLVDLPRTTPPARPRSATLLLAAALLGSIALSTLLGLLPLQAIDANAFTSCLSHYNALRIAKGYLWGTALAWLIWRDHTAGRAALPTLLVGLAAGLVAAGGRVLWDHALLTGDFDLAQLRTFGPGSAAPVNREPFSAAVAILLPFALAGAISVRRWSARAGWWTVVLMGALVVAAAEPHAVLLAGLVGLLIFAAAALLPSRRRQSIPRYGGLGTTLAVLALITALAAGSSTSAIRAWLVVPSANNDRSNADPSADSLSLLPASPARALFGLGLGSYPREYYLANAIPEGLGGVRLQPAGGPGHYILQLAGGTGVYLNQRVGSGAGPLEFNVRLRGSPGAGPLQVALCDRSPVSSPRCDSRQIAAGLDWSDHRVQLSPRPGARGIDRQRLLILHQPKADTMLDIDGMGLRQSGADILKNGRFTGGLTRWFITSDIPRAWRAATTPLQILIEQGWIGLVLTFGLLAGAATSVLTRRRDPSAAAALASIAALVTVGLFESVLCGPRIIVLCALLIAAARLTADGNDPLPAARTARRS